MKHSIVETERSSLFVEAGPFFRCHNTFEALQGLPPIPRY